MLSAPPSFDNPIRAELFGVERLEQHGESLAAAQPVIKRSSRGRRLLARVEDNGRVLRESYRVIANAIREERAIVPAAEWLVDNFHVVDEQLREIRDDLPPGFYRELPKLADGPLAGYPRVYGIAWAFVAHTDSRFDPEMLRRFVLAYQRVQPLMIGELWAVAITLRVVLVENLRRLAESIVRGRAMRQEADALADELLGIGDDGAVAPTARGLARFEGAPLVTAFAVQLVQRLREQDRAVTPALLWLDRRLAAQGTTSDDIVRVEHQRQAAMNVTVRNVILSMSLMSALDWTEFFESVSLVDEVLRAGPNHAAMDFATLDAYRHAIEELARGSGRSELDVAREAMTQAHRPDSAGDERRRDPGFYLIGNAAAPTASPVCRPRDARLPGNDRCAQRRPDCPASAGGLDVGGGTRLPHDPRAPCPRSGLGPGDRAAESKCRRAGHAGNAAPARAARWRAVASSNAGRRADAAD
jgi:cyclic beta-1,2-glucan glucanotransferase